MQEAKRIVAAAALSALIDNINANVDLPAGPVPKLKLSATTQRPKRVPYTTMNRQQRRALARGQK